MSRILLFGFVEGIFLKMQFLYTVILSLAEGSHRSRCKVPMRSLGCGSLRGSEDPSGSRRRDDRKAIRECSLHEKTIPADKKMTAKTKKKAIF
jgi:hypothetical protein